MKEKVNLVNLVGKQMRMGNRINQIEKEMPSKGDLTEESYLKKLGSMKADLDKIEFDIQDDLMQTLKEVFEKERKPGQSFNDWFKSKPLDELKRLSLANGGTVEEKYGDLIDAFEKGIDVMPGEDLTKYIERIRKSQLLEKVKED